MQHAILQYWRTNITDAALGSGAFREIKEENTVPAGSYKAGKIPAANVEQLFSGVPKNIPRIAIRLWPHVAKRRSYHASRRYDGLPEYVAPLICVASMDRQGTLSPVCSLIARDVLDPLPMGAFSIGTVDTLDTFLTQNALPREGEEQWPQFIDYMESLLQNVAPGWPGNEDSNYKILDKSLIEKGDDQRAITRSIIALYDGLLHEKPISLLLDNYTSGRCDEKARVLDSETPFAKRLGHSNSQYPLADQQRTVLAHMAVAEHGEIIAVNGPPGTGKTTLVLSAVAGEWVKAALNRTEPPVIVAASSNNQAVTNIIDAFERNFEQGDGPFAGRWLPDIKSFGLYLPSQAKEEEASRKYQTESFFTGIETRSYVERARNAYLRAAKLAFPDQHNPTVEAVVESLHCRLTEEAAKLKLLDSARVAIVSASAEIASKLGNNPEAELERRQARQDKVGRTYSIWKDMVLKWERYCLDEPILFSLFAFLPPVATKRALRAKVFLRGLGIEATHVGNFAHLNEIDTYIKKGEATCRLQLAEAMQHADAAERLIAARAKAAADWREAVNQLGVEHAIPFDSDDIMAVDRMADRSIRFTLFLLATHYWEGRWLLTMNATLPAIEEDRKRPANRKGRGKTTVAPRWRRRMMLTPCAVATFFSLPNKLAIKLGEQEGFRNSYLYDFIDWLIVDEAGQVSPQIAAPAFSLARRALVIGDVRQIEPISSLPKAVDYSNMLKAGVIPQTGNIDIYKQIVEAGMSAEGSAMRVAQAVSRYHPYENLDRGLYLLEHRRCYDEIIAYCNALCYNGVLLPKRGSAERDSKRAPYRPLAYLHIDGRCMMSGGSRFNELEAQTIAAWLVANRRSIEEHYLRPLEEVVGVVTPFGHQTRAIMQACREHNIAVGSGDRVMTVGTVHALQGAERPIILFSPVYSKHADGSFIDSSPSMLNVAVSRAKDSFMLFGDLDTFSTAVPETPRAMLASFMFADAANALVFEARPRRDLMRKNAGVRVLSDAQEHDEFLLSVLAHGEAKEIHIVSPWMKTLTMERTGIMAGLYRASDLGRRVRLYVDPVRAGDGAERDMDESAQAFKKAGVELVATGQLHSKIVIVDRSILCVGSFNWLSANRGQFAQHETSLVYEGDHLENEIKIILASLEKRSVELPKHAQLVNQ